jgi:hypothetical protein
MKDLVHRTVVKLAKLTAKSKPAFYVFALIVIPVSAAIQLCSEHLPELWASVRENFATLEKDRQTILGMSK